MSSSLRGMAGGKKKNAERTWLGRHGVYQRLLGYFGAHKRFIKFISYDQADYSITMEYMVNGTLRTYIEAYDDLISQEQRHQWVLAMAEGMDMLHSANIVHCDFSPRNMLLDENLELKVADFGCVSMDGSKSSAGGMSERFKLDDDLFALGSSIYEVLTGKPPYMELGTQEIQTLYSLQQFPDLVGLDMRDVIRDCWLLQARSAREVHRRISEVILTRS
ncbi:hypothetical protein LTR87_016381 [Friedmanniomyces endolithicus]|nr:hypothetical protein LTR87_016381 [Friedmanniomyces endolithicus]